MQEVEVEEAIQPEAADTPLQILQDDETEATDEFVDAHTAPH